MDPVTNLPCQNCSRNSIPVRVKIPTDLSYPKHEGWDVRPIDACIAPMVRGLQGAGIDMRHSCCGHGQAPGKILLQDGRTVLIVLNQTVANSMRDHGIRLMNTVGDKR